MLYLLYRKVDSKYPISDAVSIVTRDDTENGVTPQEVLTHLPGHSATYVDVIVECVVATIASTLNDLDTGGEREVEPWSEKRYLPIRWLTQRFCSAPEILLTAGERT